MLFCFVTERFFLTVSWDFLNLLVCWKLKWIAVFVRIFKRSYLQIQALQDTWLGHISNARISNSQHKLYNNRRTCHAHFYCTISARHRKIGGNTNKVSPLNVTPLFSSRVGCTIYTINKLKPKDNKFFYVHKISTRNNISTPPLLSVSNINCTLVA